LQCNFGAWKCNCEKSDSYSTYYGALPTVKIRSFFEGFFPLSLNLESRARRSINSEINNVQSTPEESITLKKPPSITPFAFARRQPEPNAPVKTMHAAIQALIVDCKGPAPSLVMVGGGREVHHAQEAAARSHATAEMDALMTVAL
jgi:hypothetical protein